MTWAPLARGRFVPLALRACCDLRIVGQMSPRGSPQVTLIKAYGSYQLLTEQCCSNVVCLYPGLLGYWSWCLVVPVHSAAVASSHC